MVKVKAPERGSQNQRAHTYLNLAKVLPAFIERVENATVAACWKWLGCIKREKGYARWRGTNAHRWLYEFLHGVLPGKVQLDHTCRNPACVNPFHMEPVSAQENVQRIRMGSTSVEEPYEPRFQWRGSWRKHKPL